MGKAGRTPRALLPLIALFALLNAALYCLLLPLWEGFDEPFHFGYVQTLSVRSEWPALGKAKLSREVSESLRLAPGSYVVRQNLPFVTTFGEYAALPAEARRERRAALKNLSPRLRESEDPNTSNYEAQQAPLAYMALALGERLWGADALLERVLKLRLAAAMAACLLQFSLGLVLARLLGLPRGAKALALFLIFSGQMFYAATARIGNDWLAIPLTTLVVIAALRFHRTPRWPNGVLLGAVVAAGMMAKAYFLFWALFAAALAAWLVLRKRASPGAAAAMAGAVAALAGPWYLRNLLLYGNLSGLLTASGLGIADVWRAARNMPWGHVLGVSARGAIWTGNNSFTAFSSATVYAVLFLMLAAAMIWMWRSRHAGEWLVAAGCLGFCATLMYAGALFYAYTKTGQYTQAPWYPQAISAPVACLLSLGLSRAGRVGRLLGRALSLAAAYLIGSTYLVKLIPMYAGYGESAMKPARLLKWYWGDAARWMGILGDTALGDPRLILWLAAAVTAAAAAICAMLWRDPCG